MAAAFHSCKLTSLTCKFTCLYLRWNYPAAQNLRTAVTDFTHAIGLLVRRVRAAAAAHELSLTESAVLARLAKRRPCDAPPIWRARKA